MDPNQGRPRVLLPNIPKHRAPSHLPFQTPSTTTQPRGIEPCSDFLLHTLIFDFTCRVENEDKTGPTDYHEANRSLQYKLMHLIILIQKSKLTQTEWIVCLKDINMFTQNQHNWTECSLKCCK